MTHNRHGFSEKDDAPPLEPDAMPNESTDHRGLRLRRDPTPSYPLFGWRYPGRSVYWDLETDKDGFIPNEKGLSSAVDRDAEVSIWMVGGSTVAGSGASANNRTISAQLEALLRKKSGPTVSVVNAGVGGWFSQNELAFITQELLPLHRPDAVIVMNGYNDTWRAVVAGAKFRTDDRGDPFPMGTTSTTRDWRMTSVGGQVVSRPVGASLPIRRLTGPKLPKHRNSCVLPSTSCPTWETCERL